MVVKKVLFKHVTGLNIDRREAWTGENKKIDDKKMQHYLLGGVGWMRLKFLFFFLFFLYSTNLNN